MKQKIFTLIALIVVIGCAGLFWHTQRAPAPVKATAAAATSLPALVPETRNLLDPKFPALNPPNPDPQADLKTALADMARLIRAGRELAFNQTYLAPDESAKNGSRDGPPAQTPVADAAPNPQWQQKMDAEGQLYDFSAKQPPPLNAAGDEATYTYTLSLPPGKTGSPAPPPLPFSFTMVKINGKWYLKPKASSG